MARAPLCSVDDLWAGYCSCRPVACRALGSSGLAAPQAIEPAPAAPLRPFVPVAQPSAAPSETSNEPAPLYAPGPLPLVPDVDVESPNFAPTPSEPAEKPLREAAPAEAAPVKERTPKGADPAPSPPAVPAPPQQPAVQEGVLLKDLLEMPPNDLPAGPQASVKEEASENPLPSGSSAPILQNERGDSEQPALKILDDQDPSEPATSPSDGLPPAPVEETDPSLEPAETPSAEPASEVSLRNFGEPANASAISSPMPPVDTTLRFL